MNSKFLNTAILTLALCLFTLPSAYAASKVEIDANVKATISTFFDEVKPGKELFKKANGVLIFPKVYKAGIGIGGEYGEGALQIKGKTVATTVPQQLHRIPARGAGQISDHSLYDQEGTEAVPKQ